MSQFVRFSQGIAVAFVNACIDQEKARTPKTWLQLAELDQRRSRMLVFIETNPDPGWWYGRFTKCTRVQAWANLAEGARVPA